MKNLISAIITAACVIVCLGTASAEAFNAGHFNNEGMKYYRSKDYERATLSFQKSISIDPNHKLANYNLACMYALLFECEAVYVADYYYGREIIYKQLARAYYLDSGIKEKALKDRDFEKIRGTAGFWKALGYKTNAVMVNMMLPGSTWYTGRCSGGALGCESMSFNADKTVRINTIGPECGFEDAAVSVSECLVIQKRNRGNWKIKDALIIIKFQDGRVEKYSFPDGKGIMKQINGKKTLQDYHPDPCSA